MAQLRQMLERKSVNNVTATYLKTAKNAPVVELFEKLGFETVVASEERKDYKAGDAALPSTTGVFKEVVTGL